MTDLLSLIFAYYVQFYDFGLFVNTEISQCRFDYFRDVYFDTTKPNTNDTVDATNSEVRE